MTAETVSNRRRIKWVQEQSQSVGKHDGKVIDHTLHGCQMPRRQLVSISFDTLSSSQLTESALLAAAAAEAVDRLVRLVGTVASRRS